MQSSVKTCDVAAQVATALLIFTVGCASQVSSYSKPYAVSRQTQVAAPSTTSPYDRAALLKRARELEKKIAAQRVYARNAANTANQYKSLEKETLERNKGDEAAYYVMRGLAVGMADAAAQELEEIELEYQRVLMMLQENGP